MMKKLLLTILGITFFTAVLCTPVFADGTTCQPIYGGGQTCQTPPTISINKTVFNPDTNQYVDNLGVNDHKFAPNDTVTFQITTKNTSGSTENNIQVKDVFPQYTNPTSGNPGSYDQNSKTLNYTIDSLGANQTNTITVKAVVSSDLSANQGTVCVVNQANATVSGVTAQDNAQFCMQKPSQNLPVFPAPTSTTTPQTGPEALGLLALLPTGVTGWLLRRKTSLKK